MNKQFAEGLKNDPADPEAVEALWTEYYPRLKSAIRYHVRSIRTPVANESEIALSAIHSLVRQANAGRFPDLSDNDQLWKLLKTIAIYKTRDLRRHLHAKKRGGGRAAMNHTDLANRDGEGYDFDVRSQTASPSMDLEVSELFNTLLAALPDDRHRDVVLLKLQGVSLQAIAERLSVSTRTVQRLLSKIEQQWQTELH